MIKLTQTQLSVLSQAAARDDGAACVPGKLNRSSAAKLAASFVSRKLMREVRAKAGMPIWREDEGRKIALVILKAGRLASGVVAEARIEAADAQRTVDAKVPEVSDTPPSKPIEDVLNTQPHIAADAPRRGSKQALVVDMLSSPYGAPIEALIQATGWLAHTTRAALTGLRKRGYAIERSRGPDGVTRYCLGSAPASANAQA